MRITNGYVIDVTCDGMHDESRFAITQVFIGDEALEEVKDIIREVLDDWKGHWCDFDDKYVPVNEVLKNNDLLEMLIDWGGVDIGGYEITILRF